jgi:hypothetical protein
LKIFPRRLGQVGYVLLGEDLVKRRMKAPDRPANRDVLTSEHPGSVDLTRPNARFDDEHVHVNRRLEHPCNAVLSQKILTIL